MVWCQPLLACHTLQGGGALVGIDQQQRSGRSNNSHHFGWRRSGHVCQIHQTAAMLREDFALKWLREEVCAVSRGVNVLYTHQPLEAQLAHLKIAAINMPGTMTRFAITRYRGPKSAGFLTE